MKAVVVYSSKFGQTRAAAERIAEALEADIFDLGKESPDLSGYDKVFVGTGIYAGKPSKSTRDFVYANPQWFENASLFVSCAKKEEKAAKQLEEASKKFKMADAIFFNKPKKQVYVPGSKLEEYIASIVS